MRGAILCAALLLGGCAGMPVEFPDPGAGTTVAQLRAEHRYVSALELLKQRDGRRESYRSQRRALLDAAAAYQKTLFAEVDELVARDLYAAAQLQLETALPELPQSAALRRYTERFHADRDSFVAAQLEQLSQIRGQNLLREQALYEKLIGVNGDYEMQVAVERFREDSEYFARQLHNRGVRALEAADYDSAVQLLGTANQLHPNKATANQLETAYRELLAAQNREQSELEQQRSARVRALGERFAEAMRAADYATARRHLDEAAALDADSRAVRQWRRQLQAARSEAVADHIAAGDRLYAEGRVEEALKRWRSARALETSTELQSRIERAQRLMERYRELKEIPVER